MKKRILKNRPAGRALSLMIGALVFSLACSTGSVNYLSPDEVNHLPAQAKIEVVLKDGGTLKLTGPRVQDGKLFGISGSPDQQYLKEKSHAVPLSEIKLVKIKKKGDLIYAFIPAAIAAVWLIIGAATAPPPPPSESCPFIYSWDGDQYVFEAEPYGGAICRGLQRSEWCRLDWLRAADGSYRVRIANELDETQYTDEARLLVVDHDPGLRIVADTSGGVHAFGACQAPFSARDEDGRDIRSLVAANDLLFWESGGNGMSLKRKTNLRHDLRFIFPKPAGAKQARLLANVWTSSWGAEVPKLFLSALGRDLASFYREVNAMGPAWQKLMAWFLTEELYLLPIQVRTSRGWRTRGYIQGGGPFVAKDKAYVFDIGDVPGDTLELKLCPPVTFWRINQLAMDFSPDPPLKIQELAPRLALDQDGQDVTGLLEAMDRGYLIAARAGDWTDLNFAEPPRSENLERSFILKINGYYDIHLTANGESRPDLVERFLNEPGFTLRYALDEFLKQQKPKR